MNERSPILLTGTIAVAFLSCVVLSTTALHSPWILGISIVGALACAVALVITLQIKPTSGSHSLEQDHIGNRLLAYARLDGQGKITSCSEGFLNLSQMAKDAIVGKSLSQLAAINYQEAMLLNPDKPIAFQLTGNPQQWFEAKKSQHFGETILLLVDVSHRVRADALEMKDPITALGNQRAYDKELPVMFAKAQRNESYLTLAIINLDFFNEFNISYGHEEGNKALKQLAEAVTDQLRRPTDHCYRLNGDEFVIIFEHDAPNVCRRALDKVLHNIENQHLPQQNSPVSAFITASIGAFGARGNQLSDIENLYMTADLQLFKAKKERNSIHSFFPNETLKLDPQPLAAPIKAS